MKPDLTHGQAIAWSLFVLLALVLTMQEVAFFVPALAHDLVLRAGVEIVVYLVACALFSARRPGRSFEDVFAFRRVSVPLLVVAALLGLSLRAPADFAGEAILKLWPMPKEVYEEFSKILVPRNFAHGVALAVVVGLAGPFVEELLYRGALFTGLRSTADPVSTAMTTGFLFALAHVAPRFWPIYLVVAACLGFLRAASGSLWPCVLMHGVFNGTAVVMAFSPEKSDAFVLSPVVVGVSALLSVLLIAAAALLARQSGIAERARALDVQPRPEPGVGS